MLWILKFNYKRNTSFRQLIIGKMFNLTITSLLVLSLQKKNFYFQVIRYSYLWILIANPVPGFLSWKLIHQSSSIIQTIQTHRSSNNFLNRMVELITLLIISEVSYIRILRDLSIRLETHLRNVHFFTLFDFLSIRKEQMWWTCFHRKSVKTWS